MNYKANFRAVRDDRTRLVNDVADLETENRRLREAIDRAMDELVIDEFDSAYDILERAINKIDLPDTEAV